MRVCVFCGSSSGENPIYREAAEELGRLLVAQRCELVYGAGSVGLMGVVADAVLAAGGKVTGIIPELLAVKELLHTGCTTIETVHDMHSRKARMAELSDRFIALPGGYGTLEELFEVITWAQLGIHAKSIGLLNTNGFFDPLVELVDRCIQEKFIKPDHRRLLVVESTPAALWDRLESHQLPAVRKWMNLDQT